MDYKREFENLQKEIEDKKIQRAKFEERLANLQKEEKQIKEELKELGIEPTDLDKTIEKLEKEIQEELAICNKKLQ